jgi:hypothetical protein
LPQTSAQNHPPTKNLSSTTEGLEHAGFDDIPEVELQHATNNNTSTVVTGSSQHGRGSNSNKTNGGTPHQSPPQTPSPIQAIQENVVLELLQVEDWEDEAFEDEAT